MNWETVIGIEVHAELMTESKVFCGCRTDFGASPNSQVCPVCLGMPGVLPVLNRKAVEYCMKAALALNCTVSGRTKFDRKNYFYPDLPKAYQISQYDMPIGRNGYMDIEVDGKVKRIRIRRVHLEEETGKLVHAGDDITSAASSMIDFNRCGIPLIEIVSEADMRSADEAKAYLAKLRSILLAVAVSDCKMEEGSMRCEANVSVRPEGSTELGSLTEMKNIASFKAVYKAIEFEAKRQAAVLEAGGRVRRETRHWDDAKSETVFMRSKEQSHDYRYFPEPDLVPLEIDEEWVDNVRGSIPELPDQKKARYVSELGIGPREASLISQDVDVSCYFERALLAGAEPKTLANWVTGELAAALNASGRDASSCPVTPEAMAELLDMLNKGEISGKTAKEVFAEAFGDGGSPRKIVEAKGLGQISGDDELRKAAVGVIGANPGPVSDYLGGKDAALTFLVGQLMKATRGRANPKMANEILRQELEGLKEK
ncbi:MAG TPA: Asp-tRNA(Asn)/Glu-tRNA(Gln) amidotransferase subunit GatB [Bacillota bacterium]|nr:Asp-tRNA(Asn)/Glu-tRNA(Gln) amidotransferase subunit GatB [Bacillota bacterium]